MTSKFDIWTNGQVHIIMVTLKIHLHPSWKTLTRKLEVREHSIHIIAALTVRIEVKNFFYSSQYFFLSSLHSFLSLTFFLVYVVVGDYFEHLGMLLSLLEKGLLSNGEYFVIGVDVEQYDPDQPDRYFSGILKNDIFGSIREGRKGESLVEKAFQSYFGVFSSPPTGFDHFSLQVNRYMQMPPFQFPNPVNELGGLKHVRSILVLVEMIK